MHKLSIRTHRLTDGSETYDVLLEETYDQGRRTLGLVGFRAITLNDAVALASCLKDAVGAHTNDDIAFVEA